jgi:hypothetical protein
MSLPKVKLELLKGKSLLAILENAVKSDVHIYRNLFAKDDAGNEYDILDNGLNSCAVFVSWVLLALDLIEKPHASVDATEKDLLQNGWFSISDLKPGAVIIWEALPSSKPMLGKYDTEHRHIGFYIGNESAISNDSKVKGVPIKHHYTYNGARKIEKILWHKELDD